MIKTRFFLGIFLLTSSCQTAPMPVVLPSAAPDTSQAWQDGESAYFQYLAEQDPSTPQTLTAIQGQWIDANGIGQWSFYSESTAQNEMPAPDVFQLFAQLRHQWEITLSPLNAQQAVYWTPHTGWQSGILSTEGTQP